jgi:phosphoribosylformimino-5-aminoimidazole carboxamide ribotide isomerase
MPGLTLYPAIDLLGGRCVRLLTGDVAGAEVFDDDPVAVARRWREAGAQWLHIVDLDGALAGEPRQLAAVRAIVDAIALPVQVGGGLRAEASIEAALAAGAARVVLDTAALADTALLGRCLELWNERIAVSVDSRGGRLTAAGWLEMAGVNAADVAVHLAGSGVRTLLFTNLAPDGTLTGVDTGMLRELRLSLPDTRLIAAGGIASLDDLRALARAGLDGAVLGRALYEGALSLTDALRVVRELPPDTEDVGEAANTANTADATDTAEAP